MMDLEKSLLIVFETTNYAMQGERAIKSSNLKYQVIPVPREITASCGISIKIPLCDLESIKELMEEEKIHVKNLYSIEGNGKNKIIEKIL